MGLLDYLKNAFCGSSKKKEETEDEMAQIVASGLDGHEASVLYVALPQITVIGMKHHHAKTGNYVCVLEEEPTNEYDPNAVALYTIETRNIIGYVARDMAADIKAELRGGRMLYACHYEDGDTYMTWGFPCSREFFLQNVWGNKKYFKDGEQIFV